MGYSNKDIQEVEVILKNNKLLKSDSRESSSEVRMKSVLKQAQRETAMRDVFHFSLVSIWTPVWSLFQVLLGLSERKNRR